MLVDDASEFSDRTYGSNDRDPVEAAKLRMATSGRHLIGSYDDDETADVDHVDPSLKLPPVRESFPSGAGSRSLPPVTVHPRKARRGIGSTGCGL